MDQSPSPRHGYALVPPALTLAGWRLRHTWRLLLVTGLGMLVAVLLVAAVPLFALVATSAGLRAALVSAPNGTDVSVAVRTTTLTPALQQQVQETLFPVVQREVGAYLAARAPQFSLQTAHLPLADVRGHTADAGDVLSVWGIDPAWARGQVQLLNGRFPTDQGVPLEIALSAASAQYLHVQAGDTITFAPLTAGVVPAALRTAQVVGIFALAQPQNPLWHGEDFVPRPAGQVGTAFVALTTRADLLTFAAHALPTVAQSAQSGNEPAALTWDYQIDPSRLTAAHLDALLHRFDTLQVAGNDDLSQVPGVQYVQIISGTDALRTFQARVSTVQVPITLLLVQVVALVLFFVSLMANSVIESQTEAIALLRSRGANRRQVFGALALQVVGLAIGAALLGPGAAIMAVRLVAAHLLAARDRGALNVLDGNPIDLLWHIRWYILVVVAVAIAATLNAISRALGTDVLALRRTAACDTRRPLWQRLHLDVICALIGLTGYVSYTLGVQRLPLALQANLASVALIAPLCLLLAVTLLVLRLFPRLLALAARLASHSRRATPVLALAQVARAPQQTLRLTLLLALTIAFALFTLVFAATEQQHARDAAAYAVGADFVGMLPPATVTDAPAPLAQEARYAGLPGVTSATIGYRVAVPGNTNIASLQETVFAVNTATYAQTAIWPASTSPQSLTKLMQLLQAGRAQAQTQNVVPAIVDAATWQGFDLAQTPAFTLAVPGTGTTALHLVAVAHVAHIASIYDLPGADTGGGVLVDYQSYAAVYQHITKTTVPPNTIWLRTRSDAGSLTSVRAALSDPAGPWRVSDLADRRALIVAAHSDPLVIELLGVLALGALAAGVLGLLGALVMAWLNVRQHLTTFAVLRALGCGPRQIAGVLLWEQSSAYLTALGLGVALGLLLAGAVLPALVFTNLLSQPNAGLLAIAVPPLQLVIPGSTIVIALGSLSGIFGVALALLARIVARPSISQTLRLNAD